MNSKCSQNQSKINPKSSKIGCHFRCISSIVFQQIFHGFRPAKPRKSLIFIANSSKIECSTFWFLCHSQDWFPINFMLILASKTLPKRIKVQLVFCIDFWNGFVQILAFWPPKCYPWATFRLQMSAKIAKNGTHRPPWARLLQKNTASGTLHPKIRPLGIPRPPKRTPMASQDLQNKQTICSKINRNFG